MPIGSCSGINLKNCDMHATQEDKKFAQVVQRMEPQSKLLSTWELTGFTR
jgi:hypothetical protein